MKQTAVEFLETRAKEREKNNPNETADWHLRELKKDFNHAKEIENWLNKQMYLKGIENYDPTFKCNNNEKSNIMFTKWGEPII